MKIAVVYTGITSYMTDCWRELARRKEVELRIWSEESAEYRFKGDKARALLDLWCHWNYSENITDIVLREFEQEIVEFAPDVMFICGWSRALPLYIAASLRLRQVPMVLELDMPWEWKFRKFAARFRLWKRLRRFAAVFVPGTTTARYARWLGFSESQIIRGRNSIDVRRFSSFSEVSLQRRQGFLFLGRKVRDKGLDILERACVEYARIGGAWDVAVPEYIEPTDLPRSMSEYACLILPSRWEPWGVVVLEALAAGMKVIVSDRVGARFDLPVDEVFRSGDWKALARAMLKIEREEGIKKDAPDLSFYDVKAWADRVIKICEEVL